MIPKPRLPKNTPTKRHKPRRKIRSDAKERNSTMSAINTKKQNAWNNMIDYTLHNIEKKKYKN